MKKLIVPGVILLILAIASILAFVASRAPQEGVVGISKKFENGDLSFRYPGILSASENGGGVVVKHAVSYNHPDPCDFRGDGRVLPEVSDFNISIRLSSSSLAATVRSEESDYIQQSIVGENSLKTEKGFIDEVSFGELKGYKITSGAEGCGVYSYYFPVSGNRTLTVKRPFTPELNSSVNSEASTYLSLPGIIKPEVAEVYFAEILNTVALN